MWFLEGRLTNQNKISDSRFAKTGSSLPWLSTDFSCTSSSSSPPSAPSASSWTRRTSSSTSTRTRSSTSTEENRIVRFRQAREKILLLWNGEEGEDWKERRSLFCFWFQLSFLSSLSFLLSISNSTKCQNNRRTINKEFHFFSSSLIKNKKREYGKDEIQSKDLLVVERSIVGRLNWIFLYRSNRKNEKNENDTKTEKCCLFLCIENACCLRSFSRFQSFYHIVVIDSIYFLRMPKKT